MIGMSAGVSRKSVFDIHEMEEEKLNPSRKTKIFKTRE